MTCNTEGIVDEFKQFLPFCLVFLIGTGLSADIPYVFNSSAPDLAGLTSDLLENISALALQSLKNG
jgi:hypothetical protein